MATTKVSKGLIKDGAVTIEKLNNALVVTEAEGIVNNNNDVTVPTSAAVKNYVDSSVVGGLIYQGAYDASTNTPALDSRGTQIAVTKGWTYTVTVDGTFYGETVRIGDVLIAETNLAAGTGALTDWTTVQSNIDLATAGTDATAVRGLAGFDTNNFTVANGFVNLKVGDIIPTNIVESVVAGANVTVDNTDPRNPIVSAIQATVANSNFVFIDVKNETGVEIPLGTGCMAVGTDGNSGHILVAPMVADGSVEPKYYIGVLEETIQNGEFGRVVTQGEVDQINTLAFLDGDVLWCDPANPGGFTKTEPLAPNLKISTAIVLNSSTNGKIFVRVQGNEGLHELHDVGISSPTNGQALVWDSTLEYWKNADTVDGTGTANYIAKWTDGDTIGNSVIYDNGTKVGVGVTNMDSFFNQADNFVVGGSGNVGMTIYSNSSGNNVIAFADVADAANSGFTAGGMILYAHGDDSMQFRANGAERMRITSAGNVGIGTGNPTNLLHIRGNDAKLLVQNGTEGNYVAQLGHVDSSGGGFLNLANDAGATQVLLRSYGDSYFLAGNVGIGTSSPTAVGTRTTLNLSSSTGSAIRLSDNTSNAFLDYTDGAGSRLSVNAAEPIILLTNSTERMRIDSAGDVSFRDTSANEAFYWDASTARLGIGTDSPSAKLHIADSNSPIFTFERLDATVVANEVIGQFNFKSTDSTDTGVNASIKVIKEDLSTGLVPMGITFETGVEGVIAERMRITSGGDVLVGITAVNDTDGISLRNDGIALAKGFQPNNGAGSVGGQTPNIYSPAAATLAISTNSSERMRIDSAGNVGIGTSSPAANLQIESSTGAVLRISSSDTSVDGGSLGKIEFYSNDASTGGTGVKGEIGSIDDTGFGQNYSLTFKTGVSSGGVNVLTERMRITSGGNVEIPDGNITLNGIGNLNGTRLFGGDSNGGIIYLYRALDSGTQILRFYTGNNQVGSVATDNSTTSYNTSSNSGLIGVDANTLGFKANGGERMRLQSNGDLHVDGDVIAYSTTISDQSLKDDVQTIDNALDKVSNLRGVSYTWNNGNRKGQKDLGLIAQEVEQVLPELVREKEMPMIDGGTYKTVDYEKIVGVLIEAVKELKQEIEILKSK